MMTLTQFNALPLDQSIAQLMLCNTSVHWCDAMAKARPFANEAAILASAELIWSKSSIDDYLQAFEGHPEIGDVSTLRKKYQNTKKIAGHEQSGLDHASEQTLLDLSNGNKAYKLKFGFIFIVCASGKTADEMLLLLHKRLLNSRDTELQIAAAEQAKITHLRLKKLFE